MTSALRMSRQATQPTQPPTNKTDIYIDTDGDLAYIRPDGAVGKIKGGGNLNLAGFDLTLGADVTLAGSVAGGGTVSVPTGETATFARGGTALVRGTGALAGRVPYAGTNTDVMDSSEDLSFSTAQRRLYAYRALIGEYASVPQARLQEQGSAPAAVASHTVVFVDTNGDLALVKEGGEVVKIAAAGSYTLTIPATGTAALLGTAQTFSATQTFSNAIIAPGMKPASDGTTAIQLQNAAGTAIVTVDTTNSRVGASGRISSVGTSDLAQQITASGSDSHTTYRQIFLRRIPLVSLGSKLIIPIVSQSSWNTRIFLRLAGVSAATNYTFPFSFSVDLEFSSLTSISNFAARNGSGNYASAAVNGMNIEVSFTTAYTGGSLGKGIVLSAELIAMMHTSTIVNWDAIVLN